MLDVPPLFWVIVLMWAIATVTFLARVDLRKLTLLVIILSFLMLVAVLHEREFFHPSAPTVRPIAGTQATGTF